MNKKIVYVDMDGVLVDFWRRVLDLKIFPNTNKPWEAVITGTDFWKIVAPIEEIGEFWEKIPVYDHAKDLIDVIEDMGFDWYILTAPNHNAYCARGKVLTLQRMFGKTFKNYIITKHKHLLANKNCLLIDDTDEKIEKFVQFGGNGLLFPQPWNKNKDNSNLQMTYTHNELEKFKML